MDSRQAKEILLLYRHGIDRTDDPDFTEALGLADRDPELAAWFQQQRAVQAVVGESFRGIPVPEGLKEQIVSERRARATLRQKQKVALLAAAAAMFILAAIVTILSERQPGDDKSFPGFRNRMTSVVLRTYPKMDLETNDLACIHQYLAQQGRGDYELPVALKRTAGTGCKLLSWQNKPVSMVCFNSGVGKPNSPDLFLFVISQNAVPAPSVNDLRNAVQVSKLTTLSWTQEGKLYLLGALGEQARQIQASVATEVRKL